MADGSIDGTLVNGLVPSRRPLGRILIVVVVVVSLLITVRIRPRPATQTTWIFPDPRPDPVHPRFQVRVSNSYLPFIPRLLFTASNS